MARSISNIRTYRRGSSRLIGSTIQPAIGEDISPSLVRVSMSQKFSVDMVSPPSTWQAQIMQQQGFTACGVYIGGPRAASGTQWHQVDGLYYPVRDLVPYFTDGFIPIYVGRNLPWDSVAQFSTYRGRLDGQDANIQTGACGFGSNTPITLDIEASTSQGAPFDKVFAYVEAFVGACNAVGHPVWLYGTPVFCSRFNSSQIDATWMASYAFEGAVDYVPDPDSFDPSQPPASNGWQFGGGTNAGVSVDYSSWLSSTVFATYG